jgi:hypothetical protein
MGPGRGPSNEHFWQVWLKSVQRFQRKRFKCEKLTDGRLPMTKVYQHYDIICIIINEWIQLEENSNLDFIVLFCLENQYFYYRTS